MKAAFIRTMALGLVFLAAASFSVAQNPSKAAPQRKPLKYKTRNVVLIVADGLRWQEIFFGADSSLLNPEYGGTWGKPEDLRKEFWREDATDRRAALFPFLWSILARRGQIFGNQSKGSIARVTNGMAFSYPGYNEMLTGFPDQKINSNEFGPNPNMTVFEWLNTKTEFRGQVAVFATWNTFKDIFNERRSKLTMQVAWDQPYTGTLTPRQEILNELYRSTTKFDDSDVYDSFLQPPLLDFVKSKHPRVLFVGYGETDNWAHSGRYDLVLHSAHQLDRFVQELWETMQSLPEYRDQTTFVITTDHGRGGGLMDWKEHGAEHPGSENVWIAVMGPDTEPIGERTQLPPVTQAQIAATLAALLGQDYRREVLAAAKPISEVLAKNSSTDSISDKEK